MNAFELDRSIWTRRDLLRAGAAGAMAFALGSRTLHARAGADSRFGPFRVGIQSYSLRGYNFEEALEKTQKLGLHFWEAFQAHIGANLSATQIQEVKDRLKKADVRLVAWGVQGFGPNETENRRIFEFAKTMGLEMITADPSKEALPILDKLVTEYRINIAIHNHGPGSRYDKMADVQAALKDHHERIGVCIDTGHALRSGEDPVEWIKTFGKRVYGLHLKDVKDRRIFTEIGKGDLDTVGVFKALKTLKFKGLVALEYEEHPENPIAYIDECLFATRDAIAKAINQ